MATPPDQSLELSEFVKFTPAKIHRSKIKNAPYNPRQLSAKALASLKANMKRVGLLNAPVWNKQSGNLVSGHQRMSILDTLMGKPDYMVYVDMVDLDEKTEREQNIFFNNQEAHGEWDLKKLGAMFRGDNKVNNDSAGFTSSMIYQMFGQETLMQTPEELIKMADAVRNMRALGKQIKMKAAERDGRNFYFVVVFKDDFTKGYVQHHLGLPPGRCVDGTTFLDQLVEKLGIPRPEPVEPLR